MCAAPLRWCTRIWRATLACAEQGFRGARHLIETLEKIAALELRQTPYHAARVDLPALLGELRIVIEPALREDQIEVSWDIEPGLAAVWADRQSLMQVFLNLTKNSQRALLDRPCRQLLIAARAEGDHVLVRVEDTGGGVLDPEHLFRPFQPGAQSTGLGVYLSRALLRSFRGDLRYEALPRRSGGQAGSLFVVELSPAPTGTLKESHGPGSPDSVGGRSQPVPGQPQPAVAD